MFILRMTSNGCIRPQSALGKDLQVSWYQSRTSVAADYFDQFHIPKHAAITDIGGGESNLVDHLRSLGYENLTVLDIIEVALEKSKEKLASLANRAKRIVSDISEFVPTKRYDFW
ncbi:MAG: hypothetical protein ABIS69_05065 [Sediminibacterium sp.]